jgi:hypothetical protein
MASFTGSRARTPPWSRARAQYIHVIRAANVCSPNLAKRWNFNAKWARGSAANRYGRLLAEGT